jgi:putative transposase
MSCANPLWGAPRIHGELLKLGITVSQATVSKYILRRRRPPSQAWRTFLKNHAKDLIALDFFTVPTATFRVLFVLVMLSHSRRRLVHFNVTQHPTAEWTAATARGVRAGGGAPVPDSGPRSSLWRDIFASG